jgi:RNA polymerase sigma-70 factor (ECF subfamily)
MAGASGDSGHSDPAVEEHRTEALVRGARERDPAALEELIGAHLEDLRAFVRLQIDPGIRARESASDIVQSACRQALEDLSGFEYRGAGSFRAWLFTATLNKVRRKSRHHRAQRRDVAREAAARGGDAESDAPSYASLCRIEAGPSEVAMAREEAERIEQAMDKLSDDEREALLLARVVGLSHREIAPRLGRTETAVRSLIQRASVRLLAALEGRL